MRVIDILNEYLTEDERRRFKYNCLSGPVFSNDPEFYDRFMLRTDWFSPMFISQCFHFEHTEEDFDYWLTICIREKPICESFMVKHIKKPKFI